MPSTFSTFPLVFQLFLSHRRPLCQTFFNFKKSFLKNLPLALSLHMKLEGKSSNSIKNILNLSMQTHPVLGYSYPRVTLEGDWPSFWWNQHPKFSQLLLYFLKIISLLSRHTACSINLSACRVDQFKNANRNKKPQSISTIFSLSTAWQTGMSLMLPFLLCHPPQPSREFQTQSTRLCCFWQAEAEVSSPRNSNVSTAFVQGLDGWMCFHF